MSESLYYNYLAGEPIDRGDALYVSSDSTAMKAIGTDVQR